MISVDEAERIVLENVKTLSPKKVKLENALGFCVSGSWVHDGIIKT